MIRKIVFAVVLVPLAIVIVALAVANRGSVTVSLDPFSAAEPAVAAARRRCSCWCSSCVIAGVHHRRRRGLARPGQVAARGAPARRPSLRAARNEVDRLRRELAARETAAAPPLSLRPPAA